MGSSGYYMNGTLAFQLSACPFTDGAPRSTTFQTGDSAASAVLPGIQRAIAVLFGCQELNLARIELKTIASAGELVFWIHLHFAGQLNTATQLVTVANTLSQLAGIAPMRSAESLASGRYQHLDYPDVKIREDALEQARRALTALIARRPEQPA